MKTPEDEEFERLIREEAIRERQRIEDYYAMLEKLKEESKKEQE